MNKTIHELNSLTQAQADDELIIYDVSEGESKKIQVQNLNNPNYSTTEQKTGGTWIDGKPIYRQAINIVTSSSSASATETIINTATDYSYLETIITSKIIDHSTYYRLTNPNMVRYSDGKLRVYAGAVGVPAGNILILEYTKTTD